MKMLTKKQYKNWSLPSKLGFWSFVLGIVFFLFSEINGYYSSAKMENLIQSTTDFQMNIGIELDKSLALHQEYPKLSKEARIRIYFPSKTVEKEVTFANEMLFSEISNSLENTYLKIALIDPYWQLSMDSLRVKKGNIFLKIQPNESLALINGQVKSYIANKELPTTTIKVEDLQTTTDTNGYFSLKIPIDLRRIQYTIKAEKRGYVSKELEYYSGSSIEIRLNKEEW
jgi:hypothetical protein